MNEHQLKKIITRLGDPSWCILTVLGRERSTRGMSNGEINAGVRSILRRARYPTPKMYASTQRAAIQRMSDTGLIKQGMDKMVRRKIVSTYIITDLGRDILDRRRQLAQVLLKPE